LFSGNHPTQWSDDCTLRYKTMLKIARKREARLRIADFNSEIPNLRSEIIF